jgi:hypothetical protein
MSINITQRDAKPSKYPSITDIYFYLELLESVGPEASNDWLHNSSKRLSPASPPTSPATGSTLTKNFNQSDGVLLRTNESKSPCSSKKSNFEIADRSPCCSIEAHPFQSLHSRSGSKDSNGYSLTALDIELTLEPMSNLGLLFTDAAHVVLQDLELKSARERRKSSVF